MSFYATCEGEITYPDKESFDKIVDILKTGFWVDDQGYFIDECNDRICGEDSPPNIDPEKLSIWIPYAHYRNLSRVEFFCEGAKGYLVGTSTDGVFTGWSIEDGVETSYDLEKWAAENIEGEDGVPPNYDEDPEAYCEWMSSVEQEFNEEFSNSWN